MCVARRIPSSDHRCRLDRGRRSLPARVHGRGDTNYPPLPTGSGTPVPASATRPNIVFVLTDDLSWNLVKYMPHVQGVAAAGHDVQQLHGHRLAVLPVAGVDLQRQVPAQHARARQHPARPADSPSSTGSARRRAPSRPRCTRPATAPAFMGKYLNEYRPNPKPGQPGRVSPRAPGCRRAGRPGTRPGNGYPEYQYDITTGHSWTHYGDSPQDYLTTVLQERALQVPAGSAHVTATPFMLEVATFAPHYPYTPAPQDVGTFPGHPGAAHARLRPRCRTPPRSGCASCRRCHRSDQRYIQPLVAAAGRVGAVGRPHDRHARAHARR